VVEFFQPDLGPLMGNGMVKGGRQEQQDHTPAIQAVTGDRQRAGIGVDGLNQQQHQPDDAKHQADSVTNTVGYFLSQRISLCG